MLIVGNIFLAIGLNFTSFMEGNIRPTMKHIVSQLTFQTVIISDITKFELNGTNGFTRWKIPKVALSFMVYLLPMVAILLVISFGKTNMTVCRPMKAEFLLNNSFVPANNLDFETLYLQRQNSKEDLIWDWTQWLDENDHEYFKFTNLDNLIDQFNFVGYHDVCNFPKMISMHWFVDTRMKGFEFLYPGYNDRNSSGPNNIQTLIRPTRKTKNL